ncbi:sugar transferase [Vibrio breoganii]|nr:sugar transferase [Vibrio breoganii]PMO60029.1 sugar transferase [Vibrio breoganii]
MNNKDLAPVILFVFDRLEHTKKTIQALKDNALSSQTDLFIYSDGYNGDINNNVEKVREYINNVEGFNRIKVIERESNLGLAQNIIEGVTEVIQEYKRAIILEDDMVTSPIFLSYMNKALKKYENRSDVWHISGWGYPIDPFGLEDSFFTKTMHCWSWATWYDRWEHFEKNPKRLIKNWSIDTINEFNLESANNFWSQILDNDKGRMNTWAIFWYATIFENNGLCLNPTRSLVDNIGNDGSGQHCTKSENFKTEITSDSIQFPKSESINELAIERIKTFYKDINDVRFDIRLINKLRRIQKVIKSKIKL